LPALDRAVGPARPGLPRRSTQDTGTA